MFMSNVKINKCREGQTLERCVRSACSRLRYCAGCNDADQGIWSFATPCSSLPARGPIDKVPSSNCSAQSPHYCQDARRRCRRTARTRPYHRYNDERRGRACSLGIAEAGVWTWLSVGLTAKFAWSIALIVCLRPSLNRFMTSWFPIAPAASVGHAK